MSTIDRALRPERCTDDGLPPARSVSTIASNAAGRSGLLAPRWRADARGVIVGLTSYVRAGHVVRALLEAIGFQTREVVDAMRKDADLSHLKVGKNIENLKTKTKIKIKLLEF